MVEPSRNGEGADNPPPANGGTDSGLLTPQLLYKINKKIAQLTKVIYGLNTRGEELESELKSSKDAEDKTKAINCDLQHRVNAFKTKIENEMGKLRDLESEAKQAQTWKRECEALKRRLEMEGGGLSSGLSLLEGQLRLELEQARHAINALKVHHDFVMRERDAQEVMREEKADIQWRATVADVEASYSHQIRRLSEALDVSKGESESLRSRLSRSQSDPETELLRDQLAQSHAHQQTQKREWQIRLDRAARETELERSRLADQVSDLQRKVRSANAQLNDAHELRSASAELEQRVRDLLSGQQVLQRLVDDKEEDLEKVESRLKEKRASFEDELKQTELRLQTEIQRLENENCDLETEVATLRSSLTSADQSLGERLQTLECELEDKANELQLRTKNFKVRLGMVENANAQLAQDKSDLEKQFDADRARFKEKLRLHGALNENDKKLLQSQITDLKEGERRFKEDLRALEAELERARKASERELEAYKGKECEWQSKLEAELERARKASEEDLGALEAELNKARKALELELEACKGKEREWQSHLEAELKKVEEQTKRKGDTAWIQKLKRTEQNGAKDLERMEEAAKRRQSALERDLSEAHDAEQQSRTVNDQLKQKLKEVVGNSEACQSETTNRRQLEAQLEQLRATRATRSQEVLQQQEQSERQVADKQARILHLTQKVSELTTEVENLLAQNGCLRDSQGDTQGLKVELEEVQKQLSLSKATVQTLRQDSAQSQQLVATLQHQNDETMRECYRLQDAKEKAKKFEEDWKKCESSRQELRVAIHQIETERDEQLTIVQEALDEAAQEREDLLASFEVDLGGVEAKWAERQTQMQDDFEWRLRQAEKEHKQKLEEKERHLKNVKRHEEEDQFQNRLEKVKSQMEAKWEAKLCSESSRLASELLALQQQREALASELASYRAASNREGTLAKDKADQLADQISKLKDKVSEKDAFWRQEVFSQRTAADRDICDLRMKLQRLTESSYDLEQQLEEKHRDQMERLRVDWEERVRELEARLAAHDARAGVDEVGAMRKDHRHQLQHLQDQHTSSMERLREELESDKFQAVEEARVALGQHHGRLLQAALGRQLADHAETVAKCREEMAALHLSVFERDEALQAVRDELQRRESAAALSDSEGASGGHNPSGGDALSLSGLSVEGVTDTASSVSGSSGSYLPGNGGVAEEGQRGSNSGLLGKMFGSSWFGPAKASKKSPTNSRRNE